MVGRLLFPGTLLVLVAGTVLGCGGEQPDDTPGSGGTDAAGQGAGGSSASGGSSGSSAMGGAGTSGAGGSTSGSAGTAGSSGGSPPLEPQPTCTAPAIACNGACVEPGTSMNGCTPMASIQTVYGLTASGGDVFLSATFPFSLDVETPAPGLYRIDGTSFDLVSLDPAGSSVSSIAVADGTVFYLKPGSAGDGWVRSVPAGGGTPVELVTEIEDGSDLMVTGERLYFIGLLPDSTEMFEGMNSLALDGGTPSATALTSVSRARLNATHVVGSWNGDIETAPLPELASATQVMDDFELPLAQWWIDDEFVYWNKDGSYKRSALTAVGATEEAGELVTTLPAGMEVATDVAGELLLTANGEGATGVFVMPISGGTPTKVAVLGGSAKVWGADAEHVYVQTGTQLVRLDR